jgi:hypothetical protein
VECRFDSCGERVITKRYHVGLARQYKGVKMYLQTSDVFALTLALFAVNVVLVLAFRRVYVLEKQVNKLRRQIREAK